MTRATSRLELFDEFRGVAVLAVFVYHAYDVALRAADLDSWTRALITPLAFGWGGVAMFFVVSGYCIHLSYTADPQWGAFFRRRICRLMPPYVLALIGLMVVFPPTRVSWSPFNFGQFVSHLFLVHNLIDTRFLYGVNPSFWTLAVEAQLYVVYPLLLLLVARLGWMWTLVIACAIELTVQQTHALVGLTTAVAFAPFAFWCSWALGAYVAHLVRQGCTIAIPRPLIVGGCLLLIASVWVPAIAASDFLMIAFLTTAWVLRLLRHNATTTGLPFAPQLRTLGRWSYSFYLIHQPIVFAIPYALTKFGITLSPWPLFGLCLASFVVVAPLAAVLYRIVEVPSTALGKAWVASSRAVLVTRIGTS